MLGGALLAACSDEVTQPLPLGRAPEMSAGIAARDDRPDEAEMRAFAERIPGLGGYHFEDGELVVSLTDPSRGEAAGTALAEVARRGNGRTRVKAARYTFLELRAWRDGWWDRILDVPGVSFVDLDEAANQVVVGLAEPAARARVLELLRDSGIPVPAIGFERAGYPQQHGGQVEYAPYRYDAPSQGDSITSYRRPLEGGLKITYRHSADPTLATACTLGFIAVLNGVRVGITASHCSLRHWDLDNTTFFQAEPGAGRYFGFEFKDPNGHSCGFLSVNVCRGSEASAVLLEGDVGNSLGYIVRPVGPPPLGRSIYGVQQSSMRVDPATPNFRIIGRKASDRGIDVYKVGAATGWTWGKVSRTCVDIPADRPNSKLRCQYLASFSSARGDSGAPVFDVNADGTASLMGLNWGILVEDGEEFAIYTSLGSIERDLGTLQFTAGTSPGSGGPGDGGETEPGGGGNCPPSCVN